MFGSLRVATRRLYVWPLLCNLRSGVLFFSVLKKSTPDRKLLFM